MRIPRFYLPLPLAENSTVELDTDTTHYATHVLRLKVDAPVIVFNGKGGQYEARIASIGKKSATLDIGSFNNEDRESPLYTHLALAISKGERFDWALQKATELGVSAITPLFTERTDVKLNEERLAKKQQHWKKTLISACEQCQRNRLPELNTAATFTDFVRDENSIEKFILHHHSQQPLNHTPAPESVCLLVGPEGGFSEGEITLAQQHDCKTLALGQRVLRTETAPLVALSILQYQWGDF